jgi:hypothetical protein
MSYSYKSFLLQIIKIERKFPEITISKEFSLSFFCPGTVFILSPFLNTGGDYSGSSDPLAMHRLPLLKFGNQFQSSFSNLWSPRDCLKNYQSKRVQFISFYYPFGTGKPVYEPRVILDLGSLRSQLIGGMEKR